MCCFSFQASVGSYKEAEETFLLVQNEKYQADPCYLSWLARCYIMNGKARQAWELYLKMDTSNDSFNLLQVCMRALCVCAVCTSLEAPPPPPAREFQARGCSRVHEQWLPWCHVLAAHCQ